MEVAEVVHWNSFLLAAVVEVDLVPNLYLEVEEVQQEALVRAVEVGERNLGERSLEEVEGVQVA